MRIPCGYPHPIHADLDLDSKVVSADEDMSQSNHGDNNADIYDDDSDADIYNG